MRRRHLHGLEVKIEFAHTIILLQCLNFCRCDYDHSDCEKAEWYVGEICNKVAYKQCCIDNQEEFGFCYDCYAQPGHHAGYSIEYLEGMLVKAESEWCQDKTYNYTTPTTDDIITSPPHTNTSGTTEGSSPTDDPSTGSTHTHTSPWTTEGSSKKFDADITCPEGWTLVGNKCLHLINEIRTYDEAVSHCISISGNLTEPRTDIEADQLRDFSNNKLVWIGINDKDQENKFIYESNGQEASFLKWSPNEPNNAGIGEDCVMTWPYKGDGWNDGGCDSLLSFVCEKTSGTTEGSNTTDDPSTGSTHSTWTTPTPWYSSTESTHTTTSGTTEGSNTTDDPSTGSTHTHTSTGTTEGSRTTYPTHTHTSTGTTEDSSTTDGRTTYPTHTTTSGTTEGSSITTS